MTLHDWIQIRLTNQGGGDVADAIGTGVLRQMQLHGKTEDGNLGVVVVIWRDGANHAWWGELQHFDGSPFHHPIPAEDIELLERRTDETR